MKFGYLPESDLETGNNLRDGSQLHDALRTLQVCHSQYIPMHNYININNKYSIYSIYYINHTKH